jgi:hypothetical protein
MPARSNCNLEIQNDRPLPDTTIEFAISEGLKARNVIAWAEASLASEAQVGGPMNREPYDLSHLRTAYVWVSGWATRNSRRTPAQCQRHLPSRARQTRCNTTRPKEYWASLSFSRMFKSVVMRAVLAPQ